MPDALPRAPVDDHPHQPATCAAVLCPKRDTSKNDDEDIWKAQQEDSVVQSLYDKVMETEEAVENSSTKFTVHCQGNLYLTVFVNY